jgi:hypothetical protein
MEEIYQADQDEYSRTDVVVNSLELWLANNDRTLVNTNATEQTNCEALGGDSSASLLVAVLDEEGTNESNQALAEHRSSSVSIPNSHDQNDRPQVVGDYSLSFLLPANSPGAEVAGLKNINDHTEKNGIMTRNEGNSETMAFESPVKHGIHSSSSSTPLETTVIAGGNYVSGVDQKSTLPEIIPSESNTTIIESNFDVWSNGEMDNKSPTSTIHESGKQSPKRIPFIEGGEDEEDTVTGDEQVDDLEQEEESEDEGAVDSQQLSDANNNNAEEDEEEDLEDQIPQKSVNYLLDQSTGDILYVIDNDKESSLDFSKCQSERIIPLVVKSFGKWTQVSLSSKNKKNKKRVKQPLTAADFLDYEMFCGDNLSTQSIPNDSNSDDEDQGQTKRQAHHQTQPQAGIMTEEQILRRYLKTGKRPYIGINYLKEKRKWFVEMTHLGKQIKFGSFNTAEEAARAYDARAIELRGKKSFPLNFPVVTI